jgi:hypothetical protein
LVAEHESVEARVRGCVHAWHDVLIGGVGGERARMVAETLLDHLGVLAVGEEQSGVRVAQILQGTDPWEPLSSIISPRVSVT